VPAAKTVVDERALARRVEFSLSTALPKESDRWKAAEMGDATTGAGVDPELVAGSVVALNTDEATPTNRLEEDVGAAVFATLLILQ